MRTAFCVGVIVVFFCFSPVRVSCSAQEVENPAANPIDPAALNDAPVFGESGPVARGLRSRAASGDEPASPEEAADWKPRLQVVLQTTRNARMSAHRPGGSNIPQTDLFETPDSTEHIRVRADNPLQNVVILFCDDVSVEAKSKPDGTLEYGFTCKGKAQLSLNGNLISGDALTSSDGKLTFSNAFVQMGDQVAMHSEQLVITLPILSVSVSAASDEHLTFESRLEPIPDVIGNRVVLPGSSEDSTGSLPRT